MSCLFCKPRNAEDTGIQEAVARGMATAHLQPTTRVEDDHLHGQTKRDAAPKQVASASSKRRSSSGGRPGIDVPKTVVITYRKKSASPRETASDVGSQATTTTTTTTTSRRISPKESNHVSPVHHDDPKPSPKYGDSDSFSATPYYEAINRSSNKAKQERRRSKRFHNVHPAQANIRAKLDIFEGRASLDPADTADITESETMDSEDNFSSSNYVPHWRRRSSLLSPNHVFEEKDCENDPYEEAYKVWYNKGLLYFRPKGLPERDVNAE